MKYHLNIVDVNVKQYYHFCRNHRLNKYCFATTMELRDTQIEDLRIKVSSVNYQHLNSIVSQLNHSI